MLMYIQQHLYLHRKQNDITEQPMESLLAADGGDFAGHLCRHE